MKILLYDKLQDSTGLPDELLTPDLSDVCEDAPPFTVTFDAATTINCLGIGNTDATQIDITGDFDAVSVMIDKAAPWQNGLYLCPITRPEFFGEWDETDIKGLGGNFAAYSIRDATYSPELGIYVAVGMLEGVSQDRMIYSYDGTAWFVTSDLFNSVAYSPWNAVCWSPELGLFCAVRVYTAAYPGCSISFDGITWFLVSMTLATATFRSICWSPELGLFCAVGPDLINTSPDGINWTDRVTSGKQSFSSVCWSPELGLFCAVGERLTVGSDSVVATSPDGITWTDQSLTGYFRYWSVCWSADLGLFCIVGSTGGAQTRIRLSADGIVWTSIDNNEILTDWRTVKWSPGLRRFIAVGDSAVLTNNFMYSADGTNWEFDSLAKDQFRGLILNEGQKYIFAYSLSEDGVTRVSVFSQSWLSQNIGITEMTIDHNGTYIGRLAAGEYRQINTTPRKEIGFFSTNENRKTLAGGVIPGAGGYSGRKVDLDVRYKLTEDILEDIETAYPDQIARGFPFFMLLDDEAFKLPDNLYRFYGTAPISMFQSEIRQFLYSMKFQFTEAF